MFPILFSLGPVTIYTANVFYILAWCVFSFLFWRYLRSHGILEERIFDLTFYATIAGIIGGRIGFIFLFPKLFSASILLVGAFWVQPGFWVYTAVLSMLIGFLLYAKRVHLRFALVFDAFVYALIWAMIPIMMGIFFQGDELGVPSNSLPWSIKYPHADFFRHPIQVYEGLVFLFVGVIAIQMVKRMREKNIQPGFLGTSLLVILTPLLFALEFLKEGPLYLYGISINQWLLILVFAESAGLVFTKGKGIQKIRNFTGGIHERVTKRIHRRNENKTDPGKSTSDSSESGTESTGPVS